jgi:hypothetical protein
MKLRYDHPLAKPIKFAIGGVILLVFIAIALGVLWAAWKTSVFLTSRVDHFLPPQVQDASSPFGVEQAAIITSTVLTLAIALFLAYRKTGAFTKEHSSPDYWIYVTLSVLALIFGSNSLMYLNHRYGTSAGSHPTPQNMMDFIFIVSTVLFLITLGVALALFKKSKRLWYGISEILVGIVGNVGTFKDLSESHAIKFFSSFDNLSKIVVFTYLLSRGASNVIEAVTKIQEDKAKKSSETGMSVKCG